MKRTPLRRGRGFQCSPEQREKVEGMACLVCGTGGTEHITVDPAHLIDRSIWPDHDGDPLRVVPLCRGYYGLGCHRAYDEDGLDLLPYLEPKYRAELAFAVRGFGLLNTLQRVTNRRWAEMHREAA